MSDARFELQVCNVESRNFGTTLDVISHCDVLSCSSVNLSKNHFCWETELTQAKCAELTLDLVSLVSF